MNYVEYQFSIYNQPTVPFSLVNFGFNRLLQSAARRGDFQKVSKLRSSQMYREGKTLEDMRKLKRDIWKTLPIDSPERGTLKTMFRAARNTFDRQDDKNAAATSAAYREASYNNMKRAMGEL